MIFSLLARFLVPSNVPPVLGNLAATPAARRHLEIDAARRCRRLVLLDQMFADGVALAKAVAFAASVADHTKVNFVVSSGVFSSRVSLCQPEIKKNTAEEKLTSLYTAACAASASPCACPDPGMNSRAFLCHALPPATRSGGAPFDKNQCPPGRRKCHPLSRP